MQQLPCLREDTGAPAMILIFFSLAFLFIPKSSLLIELSSILTYASINLRTFLGTTLRCLLVHIYSICAYV